MCPMPLAHGSKLPSRGPSAPHCLNNSQQSSDLPELVAWENPDQILAVGKVRVAGNQMPFPKPKTHTQTRERERECQAMNNKHSLNK